jgi:hypothetical protein
MLILVGAGVIVFEAVRRLANQLESTTRRRNRRDRPVGDREPRVSSYLCRQARLHDSPALEGDAAHLRADAWTSLAVLAGLVLIQITGSRSSTRSWRCWSPRRSSTRASGSSAARLASSSTRRCPPSELDVVRAGDRGARRARARRATTSCAGARAGSARYIDLHLQFAPGTRSSERTRSPTRSRARSGAGCRAPRCSCTSSRNGPVL